ncbi:MAG: GNAT family N-acetyltransferase [Treponema sp.]|jgi:Leu/Phe-tRNA-protein transferase|nr:GNAT family N-acetyltransferase [Treponema sp.]
MIAGHIYIDPQDDPFALTAALEAAGYNEDFCLAGDFSPGFVSRLMGAGFLVMSLPLEGGPGMPPVYLLLPKMHLERSVLFFDELHESRTVRRLIPRYELRRDFGPGSGGKAENPGDFGNILERCARRHGEDWLSPPLRETFLALYRKPLRGCGETGEGRGQRDGPSQPASPRMVSFGLYRQGRLVAGEFGALAGRIYTSYSGYYDEDSAGSVQLALTGRWLRDAGFAFWDLGMDIPYKRSLGARILGRGKFLELFRSAPIC